jgi:hypothetical protein
MGVVLRTLSTSIARGATKLLTHVSCAHTAPFLQARQHVAHKRTFLYLEQLILRAGADTQCINIKDIHEGLDFYFSNRAHALKLIDFLQV